MLVEVLRLGHRIERDRRLTTHTALVARAFGASRILVEGDHDDRLAESVGKIVENWGGGFTVDYMDDYAGYIRDFKGVKTHLSMYGQRLNMVCEKIRSSGENHLIIVGGKKVPADVYQLADYNVAVGGQPHSEVSALSVFLDRLFEGRELDFEFPGGKKIVPQERGKKII